MGNNIILTEITKIGSLDFHCEKLNQFNENLTEYFTLHVLRLLRHQTKQNFKLVKFGYYLIYIGKNKLVNNNDDNSTSLYDELNRK